MSFGGFALRKAKTALPPESVFGERLSKPQPFRND
jgi:hypothetical protein